MTKPVALVNEPNFIYWELPPGKLNKTGQRVVQSAQKGPNCLYYATKRLLTDVQIRSPHGRLCAARRKAISAIPYPDSPETRIRKDLINRLFFHGMGLDPDWIRIEHTAENALLTGTFGDVKEDDLDEIDHATKKGIVEVIIDQIPGGLINNILMQMETATSYYLPLGYGLQEVAYRELCSIEDWISILQQRGALMVAASLSCGCFTSPPEENPTCTIGSHKTYHWLTNATLIPTIISHGAIHVIVVVGAQKIDESRQYIFWIDPQEANDPKDPNSQRTYTIPLEIFKKNMYSFKDFVPAQLMAQFRPDGSFTAAFYNPYSFL